jgi:transcriptional regulator with XRE-family HTH domain
MRTESPSAKAVLAANLAALMARDGLSQHALARRAGVDQKTISNVLNCVKALQLDKLEQIARAFRLAPWQLLIPELPIDLIDRAKLDRLIAAYLSCDDASRAILDHLAEREAEYNTRAD